jgi:hypothetical protein
MLEESIQRQNAVMVQRRILVGSSKRSKLLAFNANIDNATIAFSPPLSSPTQCGGVSEDGATISTSR